jgi:hypothetical protein
MSNDMASKAAQDCGGRGGGRKGPKSGSDNREGPHVNEAQHDANKHIKSVKNQKRPR